MKKLFFLPLAALALAACSESTDPNVADVTPAFAKPGTQPPDPGVTISNYTANAFYDFTSGVLGAQSGTTISTDIQPGTVATASDPDIITAPSGEKFIGRFAQTRTVMLFNITNGGTKYNVGFDLYIIGSWDGRGKQAQSGTFKANVFDVGYRCSALDAPTSIFQTTFSNQYTVQQDFPLSYLTGGYKAGTGSKPGSIDALEYRGATDEDGNMLSNTPLFRSFGDVAYHLTFSAETNPCGAGNAITFVLSTTNPYQQSTYDESWGVDNVTLQAGT